MRKFNTKLAFRCQGLVFYQFSASYPSIILWHHLLHSILTLFTLYRAKGMSYYLNSLTYTVTTWKQEMLTHLKIDEKYSWFLRGDVQKKNGNFWGFFPKGVFAIPKTILYLPFFLYAKTWKFWGGSRIPKSKNREFFGGHLFPKVKLTKKWTFLWKPKMLQRA